MNNSRILFVYNAATDPLRQVYLPQLMSLAEIEAFDRALTDGGHAIVHLNLQSPEQLLHMVAAQGPFDLAFCLAEGFLDVPTSIADGSGAAKVRRLLAEANIGATHSAASTLETCWFKDRTYGALQSAGIPVPNYAVIRPGEDLDAQLDALLRDMHFPLFVKPSAGGTSIGISAQSLVHTPDDLRVQVQSLVAEFVDLPLLVETFLAGQEYTAGLIGNSEKLILPAIAFPPDETIRTLKIKRRADKSGHKKLEADDPRHKYLSVLATQVFEALGAQDVLRIDFREDDRGQPTVIDVNGCPNLRPTASLAKMAAWAGMPYNGFIGLIVDTALTRVKAGQLLPLESGQ